MNRFERSLRATATLLLLVSFGASATASSPSLCSDPAVMHSVLVHYRPPERQVYLRKENPPPGGTPTPDPLDDHLSGFFTFGLWNDIDPRLASAISRAESTVGNWRDDGALGANLSQSECDEGARSSLIQGMSCSGVQRSAANT